ncbi:segregation/condensation protein A [archaeon]|jgi:segregation and condensation protein A|nr:segregation/condensation protein A [archaeon]MBT4397754.1 segregation/condensation protein A [archaeon]MBT4441225.1 segregation/condensation protein A [archaeon]
MEDQVYNLLMKDEEVTWQSIIHNLIKTEEMDPWDVDVTKLTQRYIKTVRGMQDMNFFISGKVVLASAILLKIKSNKFIDEDINNFDNFLFHQDEEIEDLDDYVDFHEHKVDIPKLGIKTPQARKRRVSVNDLIGALEKALKVDSRRRLRLQRFLTFNKPKIPEKSVDISYLISELYNKIVSIFKKKEVVEFTELLKEPTKEEKILTLLPLLHLDHHMKVDLQQDEAFGEIYINRYKE